MSETRALTNWNQVGGPDLEIVPFLRNRNSGSQETMQSLVMRERQITRGRLPKHGSKMIGPYGSIQQAHGGIAFTFFYYETRMTSGHFNTEMLAINGVVPSSETIADGTYPLRTEVYAVTRKDLPAEHPAARLRDWLSTPEGQSVVAETGYVPLRSP